MSIMSGTPELHNIMVLGRILIFYLITIKGTATEVSSNLHLKKSGHVLFCDSQSGFAAFSYLNG